MSEETTRGVHSVRLCVGGLQCKLPAGASSYILVALLVALLEQSGQGLRPPEVAHLLWEG